MKRPLELFGVYDRALPGKERIVLRVNEPVSLAPFALLIGWQTSEGGIVPLNDQFFWLGPRDINVPGWVFVYTGSGNEILSTETGTGEPLQALYWGKRSVVFTSPMVIPALIQIADVDIWRRDRGVGEVEGPSRNAIRGIVRSAMPPERK